VNLPVELECCNPKHHRLWRPAFFWQRQVVVVVDNSYEVLEADRVLPNWDYCIVLDSCRDNYDDN
jgi:hypothetical protein